VLEGVDEQADARDAGEQAERAWLRQLARLDVHG
jgi:hypothetical protein